MKTAVLTVSTLLAMFWRLEECIAQIPQPVCIHDASGEQPLLKLPSATAPTAEVQQRGGRYIPHQTTAPNFFFRVMVVFIRFKDHTVTTPA